MKKMICFLLMLCMSGAYVHAQWHVTPEVGIATVKRNGFGDSWSAGMKAGVGLEYMLDVDRLSLKSGLYYANRGYNLGVVLNSSSPFDVKSQNKLNRNFLQLPVMLNYYCPLHNDVSLFFAAGPYAAISVKDNWEGGYFNGTNKSVFQDLNAFDWGVSALVGLEINKRWIMQVGYDLSLGEESKNDGLNANYHTFSLSVGYKF